MFSIQEIVADGNNVTPGNSIRAQTRCFHNAIVDVKYPNLFGRGNSKTSFNIEKI